MYYSNARKTAKKIRCFFCILNMKQTNPKKEERNIEKEIQNQPPHSGGV